MVERDAVGEVTGDQPTIGRDPRLVEQPSGAQVIAQRPADATVVEGLVGRQGHISTDAGFFGSAGGLPLVQPIVGMAPA